MSIYKSLSDLPHNPHYLKRYISFIEHFDGTGNVKHHILPKSLFPEFSSLKENPWNQSRLSHRAHYVAHWLLWKALSSEKMFFSFWAMTNKDKQKINSKTYAQLREQHTQWNKETKAGCPKMAKAMSENRRNGTIPTWNKGVKGYKVNLTKEGLEAIRRTGKIKPAKETKERMSNSMSSLPRCSCGRCGKEMAAHHLNRHLRGKLCL